MKTFHFNCLLAAGCIFTMLLILNCYTMLQHPMVVETGAASDSLAESMEVAHNQDCIQCHTKHQQQYYMYGSDHYDNYSGWNPGWQYYNYNPWWVNSAYYSSPASDDNRDIPRPTDFGRRRRSGGTDSGNSGMSSGSRANSGSSSVPSLSKKKSDSKQRSSEDSSEKRTISRRQRSSSDDDSKKKSSDAKKRKE
ncbi:MAG: hypothetical protein ACT6FE_06415 [Methanosarcinaceae archaeon]